MDGDLWVDWRREVALRSDLKVNDKVEYGGWLFVGIPWCTKVKRWWIVDDSWEWMVDGSLMPIDGA